MALTPANGATAAWYTFVTAVDTEINGASTKLTNWWVSNTSVGTTTPTAYYSFGYTYVSGLATFKTACLNDILCDYSRWHGYDGMIFGVQWKFANYSAKPTVSQVLCIPNPVSSRSQQQLVIPPVTTLANTGVTTATFSIGYQGNNQVNLLHTCLGLTTTGASASTAANNWLWYTLSGFHPYQRVHLQGTGFPGVGGTSPTPNLTSNPANSHFTVLGGAAAKYQIWATAPAYTIPFYVIQSTLRDNASTPAVVTVPLCSFTADATIQSATTVGYNLTCRTIQTTTATELIGTVNAYLSDCGWLLGSANTGYWQNGLFFSSNLAQTPFCWGGQGVTIGSVATTSVFAALGADAATANGTIYAWTFIPTWMSSVAHSTATKVALGKGATATENYSTANSVYHWSSSTDAASTSIEMVTVADPGTTAPSGTHFYAKLKAHTGSTLSSVPYYAVATVYPSTKSGSTFLAASLAVAAVTASLF